MDFFIDLNKIKEAKSRKVFSLSGHIQKNSNDGATNPTNPTNPTWIGSKLKNTFRDFATFTCPKFNDDCGTSSSFNSSIDIFKTGLGINHVSATCL